MAATRAGFCSLLLGLWVAEVPVSAKPRHMTSAQWFETQHVQPSPQGCNKVMGNVNKYTKHCKDLSTFLHEPFSSVATTCRTPSIACKNGRENCHQSQKPISLTTCKLTSRRYPDCRYKKKKLDTFFLVACDPPKQKDDLRYQLVPVHLDNAV